MLILGIETSCDETAVSIIEGTGTAEKPVFDVRANLVLSQIAIHEKYGGVFPALAKREHAANITPLIEQALKESGLKTASEPLKLTDEKKAAVHKILEREPGLADAMIAFVERHGRPDIDQIAVTYGPGLEPALWVGLNAAKALGEIWNIPILPMNHMEGHIASVLVGAEENRAPIRFPAIALLISGGHTELVLVKNWTEYEIIGETKDDAVGEAFDKVARMLALPYPGGPEISRLALQAGKNNTQNPFNFPRPMLHSGDYNFSFSGLKTSVLYTLKKAAPTPADLTDTLRGQVAQAFQDAVTEVLVEKTMRAVREHNAQSLIIAGGVIANTHIRNAFEKETTDAKIDLHIPQKALATDNALMISVCAYIHALHGKKAAFSPEELRAIGNVRLG